MAVAAANRLEEGIGVTPVLATSTWTPQQTALWGAEAHIDQQICSEEEEKGLKKSSEHCATYVQKERPTTSAFGKLLTSVYGGCNFSFHISKFCCE